jgi:hypothetical protein
MEWEDKETKGKKGSEVMNKRLEEDKIEGAERNEG